MSARIIIAVLIGIGVGFLIMRNTNLLRQSEPSPVTGVEIIPDVQKDAIPPLDFPSYESADGASEWLRANDPILGAEFDGDARAYPLKIMNFHEIVNETIGGREVVVTYCPLCRSGIVFDRHLDGQLLTFGNTGALYESSMVMYDRQTETYWYQAGALGVKGPHEGKKLTILPSLTTTWGAWREDHPNTQVLSINTGFTRDYLSDPYVGYDSPNSPAAFPVSVSDDRLPTKALIAGVEVDGKAKAYPLTDIKGQTISDEFGGKNIVLEVEENGQGAKVFFVEDGERARAPVIHEFWFSWAASHPDTEIYSQ